MYSIGFHVQYAFPFLILSPLSILNVFPFREWIDSLRKHSIYYDRKLYV